jgi:DNA-binding MarR family transcriptional regulator
MTDTNITKPAHKRIRKTARGAQSEAGGASGPKVLQKTLVAPAKTQTKAALILQMLQHPDGATLEQLIAATGWLPHTMRAALTGLRKRGHTLTSEKQDGVRRYRVHAAGESGAAQ